MNRSQVTPTGLVGQTPASQPVVQPVQGSTNVPQQLVPTQGIQSSTPAQFVPQPVQPAPTVQYALPSMPAPAPAPAYIQPAPNWQTSQPQQGPIVLQLNPQNTSSRRIEDFNSSRSKTLGVLQLVFGGIAFIFNVIGIIVHSRAYNATNEYNYNSDSYGDYYFDDSDGYYVSAAIWGVVFFALSGSFAICAAHKKTYCTIVTQLIMGIIASVCAFTTLFIGIWIVVDDANRLTKGFDYTIYSNYNSSLNGIGHSYKAESYAKGCMAVSVLFLVSGILIVIVTVWSSTLGCKTCCSDTQPTEAAQVRYVASAGSSQPQVLVLDSRGRAVPGAQVIPMGGPSFEQSPLMQAQSVPQPPRETKDPSLLPPPYE